MIKSFETHHIQEYVHYLMGTSSLSLSFQKTPLALTHFFQTFGLVSKYSQVSNFLLVGIVKKATTAYWVNAEEQEQGGIIKKSLPNFPSNITQI